MRQRMLYCCLEINDQVCILPGIKYKVRGGSNLNVGKRIQDRRRELNMSVDELAKRLNKNRTTVYRYEKGDIENLPLGTLTPLAEILETTPAYLMGWVDNFSTHTEVTEKGDDKERDMRPEDCRVYDSKENQLSGAPPRFPRRRFRLRPVPPSGKYSEYGKSPTVAFHIRQPRR